MKNEKIKQILADLNYPILYETGGGKEYITPNIYFFTGIYAEEFSANRDLFPGKIHPEDYVESNHKIKEWHKSGEKEILLTVFRFKTAFGEYIWMEDYIASVKESNEKKYMAGVMLDITAERNEEIKLLREIYGAEEEKGENKNAKEKLDRIEAGKMKRQQNVKAFLDHLLKVRTPMKELFISCYPGQLSPAG